MSEDNQDNKVVSMKLHKIETEAQTKRKAELARIMNGGEPAAKPARPSKEPKTTGPIEIKIGMLCAWFMNQPYIINDGDPYAKIKQVIIKAFRGLSFKKSIRWFEFGGIKSLVLIEEDGITAKLLQAKDLEQLYFEESKQFDTELEVSSQSFLSAFTKKFISRALSEPTLKTDEVPALLVCKSEPSLALTRIAYDPQDMPTPVWDEFIGRTTNADALMAWFAGHFYRKEFPDLKVNKEQFLYLFGNGQDGKGMLAKWWFSLLGPAYQKSSFNSLRGAHGLESIANAATIGIEEANESSLSDDAFKDLTAATLVQVNPKGFPAYQSLFRAKFFLSSNTRVNPKLKADLRRLVYCTIKSIPDVALREDSQVLKDLLAETPGILFKCFQALDRCYKAGKIISDNLEELEDMANEKFEEFDDVFNRHFCVDPDKAVIATEVDLVAKDYGWNKPKVNDFKHYLIDKHNAVKKKTRINKLQGWWYFGIEFKQSSGTEE